MFVEYDNIYEERGLWSNPRLLLSGSRNSYPMSWWMCCFLIGEWRNGRRYPIIGEAELKTALWVRILSYLHISRDGGSWSARQAHNLEIVGSNPTPATNLKKLLS